MKRGKKRKSRKKMTSKTPRLRMKRRTSRKKRPKGLNEGKGKKERRKT